MSPEREREYIELLAYIDFFTTNVWGKKSSDLTNVSAKIIAEYGKSKALQGLKQAVNDTVEMLSDKPQEYIQQLDAALKEKGILTFSEVRRRYSSSYKRILKRGIIRTETEYYLINGIVTDLASTIAETERFELQQLLEAYEQKA